MESLNTLTANIQREWLARILDGSKKIEYRAATKYWLTRLEKVGPPPFKLRLINGMSPASPEATLLVDNVDIDVLYGEIRLHLKEIIEVIRWNPEWHLKYPPLPPESPIDLAALFANPIPQSKIQLIVTKEIIDSLKPGIPITFNLPLTENLYEQFADAPENIFTIMLKYEKLSSTVVLLSAYDHVFEDFVEYTVVMPI